MKHFSVLSKILKAAGLDWGKTLTLSLRRLLPQPVQIAAEPLTSMEPYRFIPAEDTSAHENLQ